MMWIFELSIFNFFPSNDSTSRRELSASDLDPNIDRHLNPKEHTAVLS